MAQLLVQDLSIANKLVTFDIKVRDGITVIAGDSATGKTLFFKEKQLYCQRYNDKSIIFINYTNKEDFIRVLTDDTSNKVVFVDNADIVVPRDIKIYRAIAASNNQFVFFGRDISRYDKGFDNWTEFKDISSNKFRLVYLMDKIGEIWD